MSARTYNLILKVRSTGKGEIEVITQKLEEVGKKAKKTGKETEEAAGMSARGWRGYIFSLQMGIFYLGMLANAMTTAQMTQLRLDDAQKDYNETLREYGYGSEEAIDAARRLELAQLSVGRATLSSKLMMAGMGLQVANMAIEQIRAAKATGLLSGALSLQTAKEWILNSALWQHATAQSVVNALTGRWLSIAVAAGAAATVGGMAGYYMAGGFTQATRASSTVIVEGSTLNVTDDVESALDEDKRRKLELVRRFK